MRPSAELPPDHVFDALGSRRRRYLCYALLGRERVDLDAAAERIAAWEVDDADSRATVEAVDAVRLSLYHVHVPKLVEDDVIRFDPEREQIRHGPAAGPVLDALALLADADGSVAAAGGRTGPSGEPVDERR